MVDACRGGGPRSSEVTGSGIAGVEAVEEVLEGGGLGSEVIGCGTLVCARSRVGKIPRRQMVELKLYKRIRQRIGFPQRGPDVNRLWVQVYLWLMGKAVQFDTYSCSEESAGRLRADHFGNFPNADWEGMSKRRLLRGMLQPAGGRRRGSHGGRRRNRRRRVR